MPLPKYPVLFYKPVTALTGPSDNIPVPAPAQEVEGLDYECELVAIIGKEARNVPESTALGYVVGYAVGNDVSHREWQLKRGGGQWALGKGFDAWAPFGPGIVSSRLIKDPQSLRISTTLNGRTVQDSSTRDMIFGVARTISFLSQGTTLLPGDIIFTGTYVSYSFRPIIWRSAYVLLNNIPGPKESVQGEARRYGSRMAMLSKSMQKGSVVVRIGSNMLRANPNCEGKTRSIQSIACTYESYSFDVSKLPGLSHFFTAYRRFWNFTACQLGHIAHVGSVDLFPGDRRICKSWIRRIAQSRRSECHNL